MESVEAFGQWLETTKVHLLGSDIEALLGQFSPDVEVHQTPFEAPRLGADALSHLITDAMARQYDLDIQTRTIAVQGDAGWVHFTCSFTRAGTDDPVRISGVLQLQFTGALCRKVKAWWHRLEPGQGELMRDIDA